MWLRGRAWEAKLNQFREDLRAAKYLLPGLRISSIWILDVTRNILLKSFPTAESWNGRLLESTDNFWPLIAATQFVVESKLEKLLSHVASSAIWTLRISERCRKRKVKIGRVSSSSTLQSGRTGQILELGKDLYCIYAAQQKDSEGSRSVHTRNCVWLKIWTLRSRYKSGSLWSSDWSHCWVSMLHHKSQPNLGVESRWNHHLPLYLLILINPIKSRESWLCWLRALQPWEEILHQM